MHRFKRPEEPVTPHPVEFHVVELQVRTALLSRFQELGKLQTTAVVAPWDEPHPAQFGLGNQALTRHFSNACRRSRSTKALPFPKNHRTVPITGVALWIGDRRRVAYREQSQRAVKKFRQSNLNYSPPRINMRKAQQNFLNYLSEVGQLVEKAESAGLVVGDGSVLLDNLKINVRNKELLIPVVGAFSAGKSSLLNAVTGTSILPVDLTPETAIPTELRYSSEERIEAAFENGHTQELPISALPGLKAAAIKPEVAKLYIDCPGVQALEPLVLVDMPGFNSPLDAHNKAISHYIGQGAHYLFVISVEEGALQTHTLQRIEEVVSLGRTFSVCLNKADLRPPSDVEEICAYIQTQLEDAGLPANVCAVAEHDTASVQALLRGIDPDALLVSLTKPILRQSHLALEGVINTVLAGLKRDKAANELAVAEMAEALRHLEQEHQKQRSKLRDTSVQEVLDGVMQGVRNQLARAVDEMARAAMRGQNDLTRIVSDEVRTSLVVGLKNAIDGISAQMVADFSLRSSNALQPGMEMKQDWTDALLQKLQTDLVPTLLSMAGGDTGMRLLNYASTTVLLSLGKVAPHPLLKVALTILPSLLDGIFGSISEGQKQEKIKEAIRTEMIPSIERSLRPEVSTFLIQAQEEALELVSSSFEQQITAQKNALAEICQKASISNAESQIAAAREAQSGLKALGKSYL